MASSKEKDSFYVVTFRDGEKGEIISLKARSVSDSSLGLSFICISDFIFNLDGMVVNPTEEHLSKRFENIKSLHLGLYAIISIEEVGMEHKGLSFKRDRSNLVVFPQDTSPTPN
tara:strand:+ start:5095 stop:5436 length:342 start_codon:yes stop_codon:yes gene_type:complete